MVSSLFADKVVYQVERKTKEGVRKFNKSVNIYDGQKILASHIMK